MQKQRLISGFTLVELLASMAVLAILALVLIPVLGSARSKGHLSKSISNVRTIGASTLIFAQENNGEIPVWHDYNRAMYWWQQLRPYFSGGSDTTQMNSILGSPAHAEFDMTDDTTIAESISYGWNYIVMGRHKGDSSYVGDFVVSQYAYTNPSDVLVLTDGPRTGCWGYINPTDHFADPDRYGNDITVALFLDGHTAPMPVELFKTEDPYFLGPVSLPASK